jgi:hypothetical protein
VIHGFVVGLWDRQMKALEKTIFSVRLRICILQHGEPGGSVGAVSDYGLDGRGSIPDRGRGFFLLPLRPDRLWGAPSILYSGYRGLFPRG